MTFLAIRAFLARVPGWLWIALAAGLMLIAAVVGFNIWLNEERQDAVETDRSASRGKVLDRARDADERAHGAAAGKSKEVDDANERARQTADSSDDPLRDAMRSLRTEAR